MPSNILQLETSKIKPYPRNPRKHDEIQIARLAESIRIYGFNQPVLVDEDLVLLAGHGRLLAAKKLGLETIPALKIEHLTPFEKEGFRLIDNKLALDSDWDTDSMEDFLKSLESDRFDFEFWGCEKLQKPKKNSKKKEDAEEPREGPATRELITCPNCMHEFEQ